VADTSYDSGEPSQDGDKDKILATAKERFKLCEEAESQNRREALDDLNFAAGDQWDQQVKQDREADRRPCLTINRLPQHIKQVTNDQRQNRPSIKVHAVDDAADPDTAKVLQGIIRHIEYNSNADAAYDTAFESAVRGGLGYWRVITQYVSPTSFEQEALIKRIPNRFTVFLDPHSREPDGSDANFGFIIDHIPKTQYEKLHPDSELAKDGVWESVSGSSPQWFKDDSAVIAEYFYKDFRSATIVLLSNNVSIEKDKLEEYAQALFAEQGPINLSIVKERKTLIPTIKWCKLTACEILEETEWPGQYIPIIPCYGEELDIDGKRIIKGIVRDAKDPQRMLNFWKSAETEAIALAPRAPYLVAEGQIENYENEWETANRRNHAYLTYKHMDENGNPYPLPQRQSFEPAVQAITQASMLAADDLKATTGIYDAALGARSNETSGVAIQRRNVQAQTSNFHFIDNLTRSLKHTGKILVDLIPKIYDTARSIRIVGEDGEAEVIKLYQEFERKGQKVNYDLSAGKYDVTVDVGPSFASKRQEAAASMMEVTRAVPQLMQVAGDLLVKNMDWPGSQEIAERIKKTLPPNLVDDPEQKNQPIPPQVQAQMEQMGAMVDQLTGKLNELQSEKEQKLLELESKERIEMKKLEVQLEIERARLDAKDAITLLNAQIGELERRAHVLSFNEPIQYESDALPVDPMSGAPSAEMDPEQLPTGGESPGLPMEGLTNHDDPNAF
jgi:hypothetical protein